MLGEPLRFEEFREARNTEPQAHFDVAHLAEETLVWEAYEAAHNRLHSTKACHDPTPLHVATSQSKPSRCAHLESRWVHRQG